MTGDGKETIGKHSAPDACSGECQAAPPYPSGKSGDLKALEDGLKKFSAGRDKTRDDHDPAAVSFFTETGNIIDEGKYEEHLRDITDASNWAIPWSDLMMTMFILFAVMLVYNVSERNLKDALAKETGVTGKQSTAGNIKGPVSQEPGPEQLLEMSRQTVKEANIEDVDVMMGADKSVMVSVRGPLLFDLGSADLRDTTREFLRKLAGVLGRTRNEIHVVGHTDNYPIHSEAFPTNWELSAARAARVARFLIEQGQLDPGRFTVRGNAMYRPGNPNSSPENKQKNRRVDIIITRDVYTGNSGG